ncbi:MAG: hypothetical protein FJY37_08300 [Betaproteobacteria bacterium]|nr:hypothetical protein [Betaproteobacteria bacterium]
MSGTAHDLNRSLISWLLALLFLLAQHAALAHGVAHLGVQGDGDEPSLPHSSKVCEQCLYSAHLGGALAAKPLVFQNDAVGHFGGQCAASVHVATVRPPFSSRAPPRSSL